MRSMNKLGLIAASAALLGAAVLAAEPKEGSEPGDEPIHGTIAVARKTPESDYAGMAKIGLNEALQTSLKRVHGTPIRAELKEDDGFLVWEVDIVTKGKQVKEVSLDAGTGKELSLEDDHPDNDTGPEHD